MWDYYLSNETIKLIILTLQYFFMEINAQCKVSTMVLEYNNEIIT